MRECLRDSLLSVLKNLSCDISFLPPLFIYLLLPTTGKRTLGAERTQFLPLPAFFSHFCIFSMWFLAAYIRGHICGFFKIIFEES